MIIVISLMVVVISIFLLGIRIVGESESGSIERLGKHKKLVGPGFHWMVPMIDRIYLIDLNDQFCIKSSETIQR